MSLTLQAGGLREIPELDTTTTHTSTPSDLPSLIGTAVVRLPRHAAIVASTAEGVSIETSANIGRTVFPPMAAVINTTAMKKRSVQVITGATEAEVQRPKHFNWLKPCDAKMRVQEIHGADTPCLGFYCIDPPNQLTCGSCWSFAMTGALGDRARIATNVEIPPLSVTYMLACGNIFQINQDAPNPCGGGQAAQGAALAISEGIPAWLQSDYSWMSKLAASNTAPSSYSQIPDIGQCLGDASAGHGLLIGITDAGHETKQQKSTDQSVKTSSAYFEKHVTIGKPGDKAALGPSPGTYTNSGLPQSSRLNSIKTLHRNPTKVYGKADTFTLLDSYDDVCKAVYERGPVVGQYFVPGDFELGWGDGHRAWQETQGVYVHSLDDHLYETNTEQKGGDSATLDELKDKAAFAFTSNPKNAVTSDKSKVTRPSQLSMGGHAVTIVGFALVDLWTPLKDKVMADKTMRIRPVVGSDYANAHGTSCPVYKVRNSWGASGPFVDDKEGVWMMLAAGDYELATYCQTVRPLTALNRLTGFDKPITVSGQRFGGIVELDYDANHEGSLLSISMQKLKALAGGDCGCSINNPAASGAASALAIRYDKQVAPDIPVCTLGIMTPAGWIFFGLALSILIVALVLVSVEQSRGERFSLA
jgi:hypothetical protein